jgi:ABC-2 type transport system permease protein
VSELTGAGRLLGLALRRDRLVVVLTAIGVALLLVTTALSYKGLYPTQADRDRAAATITANAALIAIAGPARALDTIGGLTAWKSGLWSAMAMALVSALLAVRHTRGEEERGQTELLLSTATGRLAPTAAGLLLVAVMNAVAAVLTVLGLIAVGVGAAGAVALALWMAGAGLVFGATGALAAQLVSTARAANGLVVAAVGVAFALRALGDTGDGTLTWLSPLGWGQELHAFAGERWAPLLLYVIAVPLVLLATRVLRARRDLGSGILAARHGPARASKALPHPLGLALRLQRASLIGWTVGLLVTGIGFGAVSRSVDDLARSGGAANDVVLRGGTGDLRDAFIAAMATLLALIASGFTVGSALRPRGDETTGRAEPLLATGLGRLRWAGSHLALATAGSALVLLAAGVGLGIGDVLAGRGVDDLARDAGAALAHAPAAWVLAGLATLVLGAAPRAVGVAWGAIVACYVVYVVGPILDVPDWVLNLSPFEHIPALPAVDLDVVPLLWLTAVAAALTAAGLAALTRRDVGAG